jgi:predicted ATP-binding protein involved in virulence
VLNEYLYDMEKVVLSHYRCFSYLELSFKKKVNLLIGDNASGKTTLVRALSSILNAFFAGFSDENTRFFGLSKNDFSIVKGDAVLVNEEPISILFKNLNVEAELKLNSKKGRTLQDPLSPMVRMGKELYNSFLIEGQQVQQLPLFASFSTSDIHSVRSINVEKFKKYDHKPSFGYYECLSGDGFLKYWTKRLLVLKEANKGEVEITGVSNALLKCLGPEGCNIISKVQIRHNQGKVYYILLDKREVDTENLSDGLRRLVNIIMDIAFRCMILNKGILGVKACEKTYGTVLIDEIDLHLHPKLQALVVKGLQKAFPRLQFIITSHAPMVMTGIPIDSDNKIYKLNYSLSEGYSAKEVQLYGLDASTIIQTALGVTPRSQEVENLLISLFDFIDNDAFDKASEKLKELRVKFGNNLPELAKAEAMLNFLTVTKDDTDK